MQCVPQYFHLYGKMLLSDRLSDIVLNPLSETASPALPWLL